MTQDLIANIRGVRREGVTAAAGMLQEGAAPYWSISSLLALSVAPGPMPLIVP